MTVSIVTTIADLAAVKTLLVSIPESVGLLIFGVVLVVLAVAARNFLARNMAEKTDDEVAKNV